MEGAKKARQGAQRRADRDTSLKKVQNYLGQAGMEPISEEAGAPRRSRGPRSNVSSLHRDAHSSLSPGKRPGLPGDK